MSRRHAEISALATVTQASNNILTNAGFSSITAFNDGIGGCTGALNADRTLNAYSDLMLTLHSDNHAEFTALNDQISALQGTALTHAIVSFAPSAAVASGTQQALIAAENTADNVVFSHLDTLHDGTGMSTGDAMGHGLILWAQPFADNLNQARKDGVDGYHADSYGVVVGGDVTVASNLRLGIAFGYDNTTVDATGLSSGNNATINGYQGSIYSTYALQQFYIDGLGGVKYNTYSVRRPSLGTDARADFDGLQYSAHTETGYHLDADGLIVTPNASLNYSYITQDPYTETGGLLNNHVKMGDNGSAISELGVKAAYPVKTEDGTLTPKVRAGWIHEFGDTQESSTASFIGGTQSYVVDGAKVDENGYHVGGGLSYELQDGVKLSADADYIGRNTSQETSGFLHINVPL